MPVKFSRQFLKKWLTSGKWTGDSLAFPLAFSISAQIQGLTLPAFLTNATKMAVNLEDMEKHLQTGVIIAHWDSCLEAQALGGEPDFSSFPVRIKAAAPKADWPANLQELVRRGRFPLMLDVTKRLRSRLGDRAILVAGVNGPITVASSLNYSLPAEEIADWGMITLWAAQAFCEAGVDLVIVREEALPELSDEELEEYLAVLEPLGNMARFYEAAPLYMSTYIEDPRTFKLLTGALSGWINCYPPEMLNDINELIQGGTYAVALSPDSLTGEQQTVFSEISVIPSIITTNVEVPFNLDISELEKMMRKIASLKP